MSSMSTIGLQAPIRQSLENFSLIRSALGFSRKIVLLVAVCFLVLLGFLPKSQMATSAQNLALKLVVTPVAQTKGAAPSGATFKVQPVVQITTADGMSTFGSQLVTVDLTSGLGGTTDGVLKGTTSVRALDGIATFTDLAIIGGDRVSYKLTFSSPSLASVSFDLNLATKLVILTAPALGLPGEPMRIAPVIQISDADGKVVQGATDSVSVASSDCNIAVTSGVFVSSAKVTAVGGIASFPALYGNSSNEVSTCSYTFFSGSLLSSASVTVAAPQPIADAPDHLTIGKTPVASTNGLAPFGALFAVQPTVFIKDANGLVVDQAATVTVKIDGGLGGDRDGALSGSTTVTAVHGKASFTNLRIVGGNRLSYRITFESAGLMSASFTLKFATQIVVEERPVFANPGELVSSGPILRIADASGETVSGATDQVVMTSSNCRLSTTAAGANAPISIRAIGGIATFPQFFAAHDADTAGCTVNFKAGNLLKPAEVTGLYFAPRALQLYQSSNINLDGAALQVVSGPVVEIVDAVGSRLLNYSGAITLTILNKHEAVAFTARAVDGVALFASIPTWLPNLGDLRHASAVFQAPKISPLAVPMYSWLKPRLVFNGNGNTSGDIPLPKYASPGESVSLDPAPLNIVRSGFIFTGWNTRPDGSGRTFLAGATTSMPKGGLTLFAQWSTSDSVPRTISFSANGATTGSEPHPIVADGRSLALIPANEGNLTKPGYKFIGWSSDPDNAGYLYTPGARVHYLERDLTLYAIWARVAISIRFDSNGASAGDTPPNFEDVTTQEVVLPGNPGSLQRDGYVFTGWSETPSGDGSSFTGGARVPTPIDSIVLFADWAPTAQLVRYFATGADTGEAPESFFALVGTEVKLSSPGDSMRRSDGLQFAGWSYGAGTSKPDFKPGELALVPPTGLSLYPSWSTPATHLAFMVHPLAGESADYLRQQPRLVLVDASGERVDASCRGAVGVAPGSVGTVSGTTDVIATGGELEFSDLVVSGLGDEPVDLEFKCSFDNSDVTLSALATVYPRVFSKKVSISGSGFTLYHWLRWNRWEGQDGTVISAPSSNLIWGTSSDFTGYLSSNGVKPAWVVYENGFSSDVTDAMPKDALTFTSMRGPIQMYVDEVKIKIIAESALLHPEIPVSFDAEFGDRFRPNTVIPQVLQILSYFRKYNSISPIGVYGVAPQIAFKADPSTIKAAQDLSAQYSQVAKAVDFFSPQLYSAYNPNIRDWLEVARYSLSAARSYGLGKPIIPYVSFDLMQQEPQVAYEDAIRRLSYLRANGSAGAIVWGSGANSPVFTANKGWGKAMFEIVGQAASKTISPGRPVGMRLFQEPLALSSDQPLLVRPRIQLIDASGNPADPQLADTVRVDSDSGELGGQRSRISVDGIVNFEDLTLTGIQPGDYRLTFTGKTAGILSVKVAVPVKVSFDTQGGSSVKAIYVPGGGEISTAPEPPTRQGYRFMGWYFVGQNDTPVAFPLRVVANRDLNLYAKWKPNIPDALSLLGFDSDVPSNVQKLGFGLGNTDSLAIGDSPQVMWIRNPAAILMGNATQSDITQLQISAQKIFTGNASSLVFVLDSAQALSTNATRYAASCADTLARLGLRVTRFEVSEAAGGYRGEGSPANTTSHFNRIFLVGDVPDTRPEFHASLTAPPTPAFKEKLRRAAELVKSNWLTRIRLLMSVNVRGEGNRTSVPSVDAVITQLKRFGLGVHIGRILKQSRFFTQVTAVRR